jgi:hypothetical protein
MTSVPSAERGKRPAPMTRLTAPAEPDVLTTPQRTVADAACTPNAAVDASVSLALQRRPVETPVYGRERPADPGRLVTGALRGSTAVFACPPAQTRHQTAALLRNPNTSEQSFCVIATPSLPLGAST